MVRRRDFFRKSPKKECGARDKTGIDYALWVQNSAIADEELAVLLDIDVKYVRRMRLLDWFPGVAVRERIDQLILTRRV